MNPFSEGQEVICISENFPVIEKYGGIGDTASKPKKYEALVIDEILGEFLRFEKYDTEQSVNWWKHDRFAPIQEKEISIEETIQEALRI